MCSKVCIWHAHWCFRWAFLWKCVHAFLKYAFNFVIYTLMCFHCSHNTKAQSFAYQIKTQFVLMTIDLISDLSKVIIWFVYFVLVQCYTLHDHFCLTSLMNVMFGYFWIKIFFTVRIMMLKKTGYVHNIASIQSILVSMFDLMCHLRFPKSVSESQIYQRKIEVNIKEYCQKGIKTSLTWNRTNSLQPSHYFWIDTRTCRDNDEYECAMK